MRAPTFICTPTFPMFLILVKYLLPCFFALSHNSNFARYTHIYAGAVSIAIDLSTTFAQHEPGKPFGDYEYSRAGNPTRTALEKCVAALECGAVCAAFGSGLAAIDGVTQILKSGANVVSVSDVYGGSRRYFTR
jgi:cystathionine beta-lyase/cystathionine gamma-synthase